MRLKQLLQRLWDGVRRDIVYHRIQEKVNTVKRREVHGVPVIRHF